LGIAHTGAREDGDAYAVPGELARCRVMARGERPDVVQSRAAAALGESIGGRESFDENGLRKIYARSIRGSHIDYFFDA
jgi:hypothetical protein